MPQVTVIIPAYERIKPLRATLDSAINASKSVSTEIIVVDDGSESPLSDELSDYSSSVSFIRQSNQGSIVARATGLSKANGDYIQFLDSDDLIDETKLVQQVNQLECTGFDVSYCDVREQLGSYVIQYEEVNDSVELFLRILPAPHSPIYRASYIKNALKSPLIPPARKYDPAGDVYLLYNLALHTAKVTHLKKPLAVIGQHNEERFTQSWERLGVASLGLMKAFVEHCPKDSENEAALRLLAESAFLSWRKLPRDVPAEFAEQLSTVFSSCAKIRAKKVGGPVFSFIASLIGLRPAGELFRRFRPTYNQIASIPKAEFEELINQL